MRTLIYTRKGHIKDEDGIPVPAFTPFACSMRYAAKRTAGRRHLMDLEDYRHHVLERWTERDLRGFALAKDAERGEEAYEWLERSLDDVRAFLLDVSEPNQTEELGVSTEHVSHEQTSDPASADDKPESATQVRRRRRSSKG